MNNEAELAATKITKAKLEEKTKALEAKASSSVEYQPIHPSNVPKPPVYNGKKEEWEKFKHIFMAWSSTIHGDYPGLLDKSGKYDGPVDSEMLTPEEDPLSKAMYTFLMQYCPEPTMNVIGQGLNDVNGFGEGW